MELYNDVILLGVLTALGAYIFAGGLFTTFRTTDHVVRQDQYMRYVVFWPYYLAKRPVKAFWRHIRSPKPPNRTKA